MHEYGITESIVNILLAELKNKNIGKVAAVNLNIGKLSGFSTDSIEFYFEFLTKDTILESVKLNFKTIDIVLKCTECQQEYEAENIFSRCPNCQSEKRSAVSKGKELFIESIEVV